MNVWEEVKKRLDIVDVLSEYVRVSASGQNYRALSPFKKEKTPSLMISPQKQIWHDFSTGMGGDIFGFVSQIEGITKLEALRKLAKKAGVELKKPRPKSQEQVQRENMEKDLLDKGFATLDWAANFYHQILKKILNNPEHPVTKYCLKRGLSQEIIEQFKIGYAPSGDFLVKFIEKNNINQNFDGKNIFLKVGLLRQNNFNKLKDKFSDRLTIPIENLDSHVVGFTARVLPYDKTERPKYLNSSQSEWFDKSKIWFGLNKARKNIIQQKAVILVEGNMDVVAAFSKKLDFTIASQGTSFTTNQLQILSRISKNILLAFDNDEAGVEAGTKLFLQAVAMDFNVQKLIIPPPFKDLDEFLQSLEKEILEPENMQTQPYLDYLLQVKNTELTNKNSIIQKEAVEKYLQILSKMDVITQDQYIQKLHLQTNISRSSLDFLLKTLSQNGGQNPNFSSEKNVPQDIKYEINYDVELVLLLQKIYSFNEQMGQNLNLPPQFLEKIYLLTKNDVPFKEENLPDYLKEKDGELNMVREEILKGGVEDLPAFLRFLLQSFVSKMDINAQKYIFDPQKRDLYMEIKNQAGKLF